MDALITNIFTKLEKIICLINEGDGGNDLVEMKRGKSNANMKIYFKANNGKLEVLVYLLTLDKYNDNAIFTNI